MARFMRWSATRKSNKGNLPNLIIIGAQKCGTTSLHYYLDLHPKISMSKQKEPSFFVAEMNWYKGIEWYKSQFTTQAKIYGESSPPYTNYPFFSGVPKRMHSVVPNIKLIYVLRNPIERIISHYIHEYAIGHENKNLSDALTQLDNNRYVCRSQYYMQLAQYLEYYPSSSILMITREDLFHHRLETLKKVFRFLEVDDSFYSREFSGTRHKSSDKRRKNQVGLFLAKMLESLRTQRFSPDLAWHLERVLCLPFSREIEWPSVDNALHRKLAEYLKDDLKQLKKFIGRDFQEWCLE